MLGARTSLRVYRRHFDFGETVYRVDRQMMSSSLGSKCNEAIRISDVVIRYDRPEADRVHNPSRRSFTATCDCNRDKWWRPYREPLDRDAVCLPSCCAL
jgi:hypothetical protein